MNATPRPSRAHDVGIARIADAVCGVTLQRTGPSSEEPDAVTVSGVTLDSRAVRPGDLYAALPGANVHGGRFIGQSVAAGAVAVLTDEAGVTLARDAGVDVPVLLAADPRGVLGEVAATVYGRPADDLVMIGITGTNGKTTTAYLLEGALSRLGEHTGLIGTIETRVGSQRLPSVRTTPEASELHGLLAVMRESGCRACCMEVSSHALALHRVDAVRYDVAIFTNLSQDHLDFHRTMEDYFEAKAQLFTPQRARRAIVCVDDAWGRRLAARAQIPVTTVANATTIEPGDGDAPDWTITALPPDATTDATEVNRDGAGLGGAVLLTRADGTHLRVTVGLPGAHNATNTAFAVLALLDLGYPEEGVVAAFDAPATVPGRMQRVELAPDTSQAPVADAGEAVSPPIAYVDFAHTPDAIAATLQALRPLSRGPLVAVLGAGGDRDHGKRPLMGAAAARVADLVVVTDDNPRHEDPAMIRGSVAGGAREAAPHAETVREVPGREAAIDLAVDLAAGHDGRPAGVVAVLGKGHEQGQTVGDVVKPFDDVQVVRRAWANLCGVARPDPEVDR